MRKMIAAAVLMLMRLPICAKPECMLSHSVGYSYTTNAFSNPLPPLASAGDTFIKRSDVFSSVSFSLFPNQSSRIGISADRSFGFRFESEIIVSGGPGNGSTGTMEKGDISISVSAGIRIRAAIGRFHYGASIRLCVASLLYFRDGVLFGLETEPFAGIMITDRLFLSLDVPIRADLFKFIESDSSYYENGFSMIKAGARLALGYVF